jgi:hypothetical protein
MHTQTEKRNSMVAPRHADVAGLNGKTLPAVPVLAVQRKQVLQMVAPPAGAMKAGDGDLEANLTRKNMVDRLYAHIVKNGLGHNLTDLAGGKRYLGEQAASGVFKQYKGAGEAEQTAMVKELLGRKYHDETASGEITSEMRVKLGMGLELDEEDGEKKDPDITASTVTPGDIKANMTDTKACVITALMFAEGGGVFGAKSVEELHFILSTRFKTTWRHYSEDAVFKSLYEHLGYTKVVPPAVASLENLSTTVGAITVGMASIGGHMVGFKKDGTDLYIRDNDEGLKKVAAHTRKTENVIDYWHK